MIKKELLDPMQIATNTDKDYDVLIANNIAKALYGGLYSSLYVRISDEIAGMSYVDLKRHYDHYVNELNNTDLFGGLEDARKFCRIAMLLEAIRKRLIYDKRLIKNED